MKCYGRLAWGYAAAGCGTATGATTPAKLGLQMSWPAAYVLRGKAPQPTAAPAQQPVAA